jgi:hypothetical protein
VHADLRVLRTRHPEQDVALGVDDFDPRLGTCFAHDPGMVTQETRAVDWCAGVDARRSVACY